MEQSRTARHRSHREKRRKLSRIILYASSAAVICAAGVLFWSLRGGEERAPAAESVSSSPLPSSKAVNGTERPPATAGAGLDGSIAAASPTPAAKPAQTPAATALAAVPPGQQGDNSRIRMAFVGDVIFASTVETLLNKNGYDFPYRTLSDELLSPDITAANLETPITLRGEEQKKEYTYRSKPEALRPFKEAGFDVVNLANNHIMDYGEAGLLDTLDYLDKEGILRTGAGKDLKEAYKPAILEKNGIRVAFLGLSHKVPAQSWKAGNNKPGTTQLYDPETSDAIEAITRAGEQADLVVVMAHWGEERQDKPLDTHRKMAKAFIDAGADLIIGSHPHVLQSLEVYKGKYIAYSLGNFLFTTNSFEPSWETAVLNADCSKAGSCSISLIPVSNKFSQPTRMDEEAGSKLFARLTAISYGIRVDKDGRVVPDGEVRK
jgi:poly-gamma-glutamate synthesis protein (capsule biosynthesis protein)